MPSPEIFLSAWNFKNLIEKGRLRFESLPELARANGFQGVEIMDRQLPVAEPGFSRDFRRRCELIECGVILDCSSDFTHLNDETWRSQIRYVKSSLAVAVEMGAVKMRILLGGQSFSFQKLFSKTKSDQSGSGKPPSLLTRLMNRLLHSRRIANLSHALRQNRTTKIENELDKLERAIAALEMILPIAQQVGVPLVIENHWGLSSRPENILQVIEHFDSPFLGACPDFDNFPKEVDAYDGLNLLARKLCTCMPRAERFGRMAKSAASITPVALPS